MAEPPRVVSDESDASDIDPELVQLKRKVPVGPLLAASVLGFALLLMWRLRADFAYAGAGDAPRDAGSATAPVDPLDNSFATLTGRPDATAPARIRGAQETGHRLTPFLGTGARMWLEDDGDGGSVTPVLDDRWTGRLRRIDSTPFAAELARWVASSPPVPKVVFAAALGTGPKTDANGDPLILGADARVALKLVLPDKSRVLFVKTDDIPDEAAARAELAKLGFSVGEPVEKTDASWAWDVAAGADAINAGLRKARRFGAAASPAVETVEGRAADLDLSSPSTIRLAGRELARAAVDHAVYFAQPTLPGDAWVLASGDTPASLWYMRPLYAVLAVIAILMIWALLVDLRQLRRERGRGRGRPRTT